jgi:hypothetical protein
LGKGGPTGEAIAFEGGGLSLSSCTSGEIIVYRS